MCTTSHCNLPTASSSDLINVLIMIASFFLLLLNVYIRKIAFMMGIWRREQQYNNAVLVKVMEFSNGGTTFKNNLYSLSHEAGE